MPSLVTVLASPLNYTTSTLRNRTQFPSSINIDDGGGGGGIGGIEQNAEAILPNFLPSSESFDIPATFSPPGVGNLLASGSNAVYYEETASSLLSSSSSSASSSSSSSSTFEFFEDAAEFFNSPLPFDASENGLFNGRFVPPPPRPPFLMDEPVITDGLTTCDLCSWAMPTKSTFIFEGTIEKASELGWPLTLIIVSILSAILGAIIMITVVRCKRKKSSNNRNETHVQWWSRNKRPNNNNHLRRSNIYTAHPADSIRGLNGQQQPPQIQQQLNQQATLQPQESQLYQQQHNRHNHNHFPHPPHHHHHHQHQEQPQHQQQQHPNHLQQLQHHSSSSLSNMAPITTDTCNWPNVSTLVVPS
ncbi:putative uncharacterized protein DDB_G0288537 [Episyrphus balteatus]|uniref:putative uncharacterized protein DDB_G0288537 n=1 Tax=Episyrphus balteatus TaxID=286459 RepID=UPI0024862BAE|nr:putative uncharacterized protein DDB_G0288537 [Episyrphus balteatus]